MRYLITTANELTWKFDRPVIFLGEWCRRYDRKHTWQDMDAIVGAPYGLGQAQKDADYAEARRLEAKIFPILCGALNQHHGTQFGARFWRIVLGHWLRRYVLVILNRVRTLELCLQAHQLSGTTALSCDLYSLVPMDSNAAVWTFNNDRWNNALYVRILNLLGAINCPVEVIADGEPKCFRSLATAREGRLERQIVRWGYHQAKRLATFLARDSDAFLINSYLPRKEDIKLQLALGQMPQLWTSPELSITRGPERALRQSLSDQITERTNDALFGIMRAMVFELLPVCYLEGFSELTQTVRQLPWPKTPKLIFTSNSFDSDEVFKLWAATKVESGSKYIVGQHGNNYGAYRYMCPSIEEATADKFLTWGWTDGLPQHTPAFVLKTAGRKADAYHPNGGLLLIELISDFRDTTWDGTWDFANYFSEQQIFIEKLRNPIRRHLTIRLHGPYALLSWGEEDRWRDFDATIKLDKGSSSIRKLIAKSRLIIFSFDSTGILETLSQNIPTLAFWQNNLDHLRDTATPYYELLVDAGIVHLTPASVAAKVNEVWDDVEGWWNQAAVQAARIAFCSRYARVSNDPVRELRSVLLQG